MDAIEKLQVIGKSFEDMARWCFGLKFEKI